MPDNKLTLYAIAAEGQFLTDALIDAEGEISPEIEERINALLISGPTKIQAAGHVLSNLEMAVAACEMESKRLRDRAKSFEVGIERLKARMTAAIDMAFNGKLQTDTHTYWTQSTAQTYSVELADNATLEQLKAERPDFVRTKLELDKTAIQNAYKQEQPLPDSIFVNPKPPTRYLRVK